MTNAAVGRGLEKQCCNMGGVGGRWCLEEQISGGAEGLRGREHCTQMLSGADMGRM